MKVRVRALELTFSSSNTRVGEFEPQLALKNLDFDSAAMEL